MTDISLQVENGKVVAYDEQGNKVPVATEALDTDEASHGNSPSRYNDIDPARSLNIGLSPEYDPEPTWTTPRLAIGIDDAATDSAQYMDELVSRDLPGFMSYITNVDFTYSYDTAQEYAMKNIEHISHQSTGTFLSDFSGETEYIDNMLISKQDLLDRGFPVRSLVPGGNQTGFTDSEENRLFEYYDEVGWDSTDDPYYVNTPHTRKITRHALERMTTTEWTTALDALESTDNGIMCVYFHDYNVGDDFTLSELQTFLDDVQTRRNNGNIDVTTFSGLKHPGDFDAISHLGDAEQLPTGSYSGKTFGQWDFIDDVEIATANPASGSRHFRWSTDGTNRIEWPVQENIAGNFILELDAMTTTDDGQERIDIQLNTEYSTDPGYYQIKNIGGTYQTYRWSFGFLSGDSSLRIRILDDVDVDNMKIYPV